MAGKGKPGPPTKDERIQRRADIWHARVRESLTQQQIADRFGISQVRVSQILSEAAAEITQATAEEARKAELDKLDSIEQRCLAIIEQHTVSDNPMVLAATDRMLKAQASRRALLGLDAPVKSEVTSYDYKVNGVELDALK